MYILKRMNFKQILMNVDHIMHLSYQVTHTECNVTGTIAKEDEFSVAYRWGIMGKNCNQ